MHIGGKRIVLSAELRRTAMSTEQNKLLIEGQKERKSTLPMEMGEQR